MNTAKRALIPLLCIAVILGLFHSVFFLGYVPSSSMEPTLREGSVIFGYRRFKELKNGDVIVFQKEGRLLVKRIAAREDDTVRIGEETIAVPHNCFYVLGDNRDNSYDSRYWSDPFVSLNDVVAKIFV